MSASIHEKDQRTVIYVLTRCEGDLSRVYLLPLYTLPIPIHTSTQPKPV
jgi:hypothetical protein